MQEIGIETSVLRSVLDGHKTIEGRLGKPRFLKLRVGDKLSLREDIWEGGVITASVHERITVEIRQLLYFDTFREMIESLGYASIIPGADSVDEALAVYRRFFSEADEEKYGVVAILFELV